MCPQNYFFFSSKTKNNGHGLTPAGREKQKTKVDKMTGTDIWTKKPPENVNTGNADPEDPTEPGGEDG